MVMFSLRDQSRQTRMVERTQFSELLQQPGVVLLSFNSKRVKKADENREGRSQLKPVWQFPPFQLADVSQCPIKSNPKKSQK